MIWILLFITINIKGVPEWHMDKFDTQKDCTTAGELLKKYNDTDSICLIGN